MITTLAFESSTALVGLISLLRMKALLRLQALSRQLTSFQPIPNQLGGSLTSILTTQRVRSMAHIHTPIPSLKLSDGNAIPMVNAFVVF